MTITVIVVDGMWPPKIHVHILIPGTCITFYDKVIYMLPFMAKDVIGKDFDGRILS